MSQVLSLDMREYRLLCEASRLKMIDRRYWTHLQAYTASIARVRDKKGRLVYSDFTKFFDYEKELGKKKSEMEENPNLARMARYLKKKRKEEGNGS